MADRPTALTPPDVQGKDVGGGITMRPEFTLYYYANEADVDESPSNPALIPDDAACPNDGLERPSYFVS